MNLFLKNRFFRILTSSVFFNQLGTTIYNIVFVVYVATTFHDKQLVSIANVIVTLPAFFQIAIGIWSDRTIEKGKWLILVHFTQAITFTVVAYLTTQVTLLSFSLICLLNIFSDMIGLYSNGLVLPIYKYNIDEERLMEAFSFEQVLTTVASLSGQLLGVYLLTRTNNDFVLIALINALSFFISGVLLFYLRRDLQHGVVLSGETRSVRENYHELAEACQQMFGEGVKGNVGKILVCMLILNCLGSSIGPIYHVFLMEHSFFHLTYAQTILLIEVIAVVASLLGGLSSRDFLSRLPLERLLQVILGILSLIAVVNIFVVIDWIVVILLFVLFFTVGKFNPKFQSELMRHLPSERLAQVSYSISFLVTILIPIATALFSSLIIYQVQLTWLVYLSFALFAFVLLSIPAKRTC